MSRLLFTILFLTGLVAACSAIVCTPNFCNGVKCPEITQESCEGQQGLYVPDGSICGCCATCLALPKVKITPPGDVPIKMCPYPFLGTGKMGYYPC